MKFIICTITVIIVAYSGANHSDPALEKIEKDCVTASGHTASHEKLHNLLHMRTLTPTQPEKCFVKCFTEKMYIVDAAGKANATTLKASQIPHFYEKAKMTDAIIGECGTKIGATPCDVGYEVARCLIEKAGHKAH